MARHNRMSSLHLTTTSIVEEDTVTSNEGWIFTLETTEVAEHADEVVKHFEITVKEEVSKASYLLGKFQVELCELPKISDDEDRLWVARNLHYHLWANMSGALEELALEEWINIKALKRILAEGAKVLPATAGFDGQDLPVPVKWLEK